MKPFLRRIMDQASGTEIASFPIYKVLFCARGQEGSVESDCFSFTESYRSSEDFQIHVFSCHIKEAVSSNLVPRAEKVQVELPSVQIDIVCERKVQLANDIKQGIMLTTGTV